MKGGKLILTALCVLCTAFMLPVCAFAHSSFFYDTATRPYYVLPFTFIFSVAVEYAALRFIVRVNRGRRAFVVVFLGNLFAFGATAIYYFISNRNQFPGTAWPPYMIGVIFLAASFFIEVWVESDVLLVDASGSQWKLAWTLLAANAVTGGAGALAERLICTGSWGA